MGIPSVDKWPKNPSTDETSKSADKPDANKNEENEEILDAQNEQIILELRAVLEGKSNIFQKRALHKSILTEAVQYPELEPLDFYLFITDGDFALAEKYYIYGESLLKNDAQAAEEGFRYIEGVEEENPEQLKFTLIQSVHRFIFEVNKFDSDAINSRNLKKFCFRIAGISEGQSFADQVKLIFLERTQELGLFPENLEGIIKTLVSSLKAVANGNPDIPEFQFDEREMKGDILKSYNKEQKEMSPAERELASNIEGRISGIMVTLGIENDDKDFADEYYSVILGILEAKGKESDFTLKCVYRDEAQKDNFIRYLITEGFDYISSQIEFLKAGDAKGKKRFGIWGSDGTVRRNNGTIVEPNIFYDPGLGSAYDNLTPFEGNDIEQSELVFQGGNMRATANYLFIGSDDIYLSLAKKRDKNFSYDLSERASKIPFDFTKEEVNEMIKLFEKEFGKKVVVIGLEKESDGRYGTTDIFQPYFHIDMIMTPLSNNDVVVAEMPGMSSFNKLADELLRQGFNVIRIPYFEDYDEKMITYNNVLIENYEKDGRQIKKVYLPQYYFGKRDTPQYKRTDIDYERLNLNARDVYEAQGFEVVPVLIHEDVISHQGSLNCITFEDREMNK